MAEQRGILVKDGEGNVYFLRPEILEMCKVPKDEAKEGIKRLESEKGDVEGYALASSFTVLAAQRVQPINLQGVRTNENLRSVMDRYASTVMCPW